MATSEALLFGRRPTRAVGLVVGFTLAVGLTAAAVVTADLFGHSAASTFADRTVPLLVFYAPAPLAAAGAYARCGGPACLTVGAVPALVFAALVVVGSALGVPGPVEGDAPLAVAFGFGAVGLTSAFVGYCAGVTAALVADLFGMGPDEG